MEWYAEPGSVGLSTKLLAAAASLPMLVMPALRAWGGGEGNGLF